MKQPQFVKSNFPRIEHDNYQTIDGRCMQALLETMKPYGLTDGMSVMDVCSSQGSGIINWFQDNNLATIPSFPDAMTNNLIDIDWVITNPPYMRGVVDGIIMKQIQRLKEGEIKHGLAILLRTGFDHAKTRRKMFADEKTYAGQIKMLFRPLWFTDGDSTPIHNYVWHIWMPPSSFNPYPRVWYW